MNLSDAIGLEIERREAERLKPYEPWEVVSCPSCGEEWFPEDSLEKIRELNARIEAFMEALTPSAETKAAYWGEAGLTNDWTLIKAVMKAIRERALQEPTK